MTFKIVLCVFRLIQIMKPSKFTCREICQTKHSHCRCSLSFSLITDISIMLCQKHSALLSISTQCTSSSNKYHSTPIIGHFQSKPGFPYSIQCTWKLIFILKVMLFSQGLSFISVCKTAGSVATEIWYLSSCTWLPSKIISF